MSRCAAEKVAICQSPMKLGERYGKIEYSSGKVIQRRRGSSGYVRLSSIDEFLVISLKRALL